MLKNSDESIEINHIPDWPYILNNTYVILFIGGLGSGKSNVFWN